MIGEANFLIDIESFAWQALNTDRSTDIDNLILAVEKIDEHGDHIYSHPDAYVLNLGICHFYELFTMEDELKRQYIPWLKHDYQKFLMKLFSRRMSSRPSRTLSQLQEEFPEDANGLLRCGAPSGNEIVICQITWYNFHAYFVNSNMHVRGLNFGYFKRYYKPKLQVAANEIRGQIRKSQVDSRIERLDNPPFRSGTPIHLQQIHVHFANGSALNIDGTWKHGRYDIPAEVCSQLVEWGFILPDG